MILQTIKNQLIDGSKEQYIEVAKKFSQDMVAHEEGCISFELFESDDDVNQVTMVIRWKDQHSLDLHSKSDIFPKYKPLLKPYFKGNEVFTYKLIVNS